MTNLQQVLTDTFAAHPALEVKDLCKIIFQHTFGCGHLVSDFSRCKEAVSTELFAVTECDVPLFTPIGNGYCRMQLSAAKGQRIPAELIARMFFHSAKVQGGSKTDFLRNISEAKALCADELLPFSPNEIDAFITAWEAKDCPLFSHSAAYREAYAPAYRVVLQQYADTWSLILAIMQKSKDFAVTIGIDGRCGAGKSTLGVLLRNLFDGTLIHMDDFFLPLELRTPERLSEPGGNIHYERFCAEVATGIMSGEAFSYGKFDCGTMKIAEAVQVQKDRQVTIIEGSYALHPRFAAMYTITAFCDVDTGLQRARIIKRNGQAAFSAFETRWIPMEERYFETFTVKENCQFVVSML